MSKKKGLLPKYHVSRTDGKKMGYAIILELKDPIARRALKAWAKEMHASGYQRVSEEVTELIHLYDQRDDLHEILETHRKLGRLFSKRGVFLGDEGTEIVRVKQEIREYTKIIEDLENKFYNRV